MPGDASINWVCTACGLGRDNLIANSRMRNGVEKGDSHGCSFSGKTSAIVTTLCPGGKERMRRLMELVRHGRLNLAPLLTHTFSLDDITEAYKLFGERREGVIKIAIKP
jgi:threonine dehydrogenase-like Zn-dependent dehydrogenase